MNWLETSFELDRLWYSMKGEMDHSKKPALLALVKVLEETHTPYAIIGGIALQAHVDEPRTTVDIDIAVPDRDIVPREALVAAGFRETGRFPYSVNWQGFGTPIQFSDEKPLVEAIARVHSIEWEGVALKVLSPADLVHAKMRAATAPQRRPSKSIQDFADVLRLVECHPELDAVLTPDERAALAKLPRGGSGF